MNFFSLFKRNIIFKLKKKIFIDEENHENKTLDELFNYYGSDKANIFSKSSRAGHGFSDFYTKHLNKFIKKKINILEIGSYAGSSAAAFVKYIPDSKVYCFDINISNFEYSSDKIQVFGLDINNKNKVEKKIKQIFEKNKFENFDLIIDDGSHYLSDILFSLDFFFKYLKKNGLFVIEDFKHPDYYKYNRNVEHISVSKVLDNLENKIFFPSRIINQKNQTILMNSINQIYRYKGNLKDSDICFIEKL